MGDGGKQGERSVCALLGGGHGENLGVPCLVGDTGTLGHTTGILGLIRGDAKMQLPDPPAAWFRTHASCSV